KKNAEISSLNRSIEDLEKQNKNLIGKVGTKCNYCKGIVSAESFSHYYEEQVKSYKDKLSLITIDEENKLYKKLDSEINNLEKVLEEGLKKNKEIQDKVINLEKRKTELGKIKSPE